MKRLALILACGSGLLAAVPALAQQTVTQDYPNALPYNPYYDARWDGPYYAPAPYAYDAGPYAYAPRERYPYDPYYYPDGYWVGGRYYQCTQSYTPNRPDRSAGGSNVTEQCF